MNYLPDFLLDRIAQEELDAKNAAIMSGNTGTGQRRIISGMSWSARYHRVTREANEAGDALVVATCMPLFGMDAARHIARWDPEAVLEDCEARRLVILSQTDLYPPGECPNTIVLRALALPYRNHPAYQREWRI